MNTELSHSVSQYITDLFAKEDELLKEVRENIPLKGLPSIHIRPEEGRFLQILAHIHQTKNALEIGTLGGYSGIWIARGLAPGGRLTTIELDPHHAKVAQEHFSLAGLDQQVRILVGNAHDILAGLSVSETFDFVFIDAEKPGYPNYMQWAIENLIPGGVITAHNVLRGGLVADPNNQEERVQLMRNFNQQTSQEQNLISTIYPAGDGMLLAVKKN